jgi:hypothetical protein
VPLGYRSETMVSRDKEKLIRKLLKEGKDWIYISKDARCSPNTIQKVQEKSKQIRAPKIKSKRSDALAMYDKEASSLDVGTKLDISFQEAENYKIEYWKHKNMYEFEKIYKTYKNSLPLIISKLSELQARNISLDQLSQAIHLHSIMPQLYSDYQQLKNEIQVVAADYKQRQTELWNIQNEIHLKETELHNLDVECQRIEKINNSNYKVLFETVSNIIREILGDKNTLLNAALIAIMRAIRKYPDSTVLSDFSALYGTISSLARNDSNPTIMPELIADADSIYDDIFSELVKKAISRMN